MRMRFDTTAYICSGNERCERAREKRKCKQKPKYKRNIQMQLPISNIEPINYTVTR